jgi:hypothetical protein
MEPKAKRKCSVPGLRESDPEMAERTESQPAGLGFATAIPVIPEKTGLPDRLKRNPFHGPFFFGPKFPTPRSWLTMSQVPFP